jgi:hypothetical protein
MNGIKVAQQFVDEGLVEKMSQALAGMESGLPEGNEGTGWNRVGKAVEDQLLSKKKANQKV